MSSAQDLAEKEHPDGLRSVDQLGLADARMQYVVLREGETSRSISNDDRYLSIVRFDLCTEVPNDVRVHFDTARNLYLYAWFVYRFHVVAEQQALASLEMALRLRLVERNVLNEDGLLVVKLPPKVAGGPDRTRVKRPALHLLLKLAVEKGFIHNNRLVNRSLWAQSIAEHRVRARQHQYMTTNGLTEMTIPDEAAVPTLDELNYDWIGTFVDSLPRIRNTYAHGSSMLHASVLRTFAVVSDLINQLFTLPQNSKSAPSFAST